MARPSVITPAMLDKLEREFSFGLSNDEACLECGLARSTLQKYLSENPKFAERVELLKNQPVTIAKKSVVKRLPDDPDLAMKYLERKAKGEFSLRQEVEQNITFEPVTITFENEKENKD